MKHLPLIFIVMPFLCFSQFHPFVETGLEVSGHNGHKVSVRGGVGVNIMNNLFLGPTIGMTTLKNYQGIQVPVAVKINYSLVSVDYSEENLLEPFVSIEAGHNLYKTTSILNNEEVILRGALYFFGGGGVHFPIGDKEIFSNAGGSIFSFKGNQKTLYSKRLSFRIGIMF